MHTDIHDMETLTWSGNRYVCTIVCEKRDLSFVKVMPAKDGAANCFKDMRNYNEGQLESRSKRYDLTMVDSISIDKLKNGLKGKESTMNSRCPTIQSQMARPNVCIGPWMR
jgi:hypothetical protein